MAEIGAVWREIQSRLQAAHEVGPREGRQIVEHVLGLSEQQLIMGEHAPFPDNKLNDLNALVARRAAGEPLAYVLGHAWFYGRQWAVTRDTLIPRPDTEVLVEAVLSRLGAAGSIAEVGIGTGCIGGTLMAERDDVTVLGIDISPQAAAVARRNWEALGVDGRWEIAVNDGLEGIERRFDLIVSNPPYVTDGEWENLEAEVKDFEPRLALTGAEVNPDGLLFYKRLAAWGCERLVQGGWLCMETGWQQGQAVRKLLEDMVQEQKGPAWCEISVLKDLAGRERVVCARRC